MNFARAVARTTGIPSVASANLARDYKRRIAESRTLVSASIELTYRCNLHCTHCYCPTGRRREELSTEELRRTIDDMAELGCLFLLLTGGDPLLRRDFPAVYRHAKERGMLVTVFTNGTLIDDRILALWDELPPSMVEISLYGLTREVYERVVAVRGAYDRCLAGIGRVLAAGHPLALKCPATRENAHEIPALADFAKDLGVEFRYDPMILATMEGSTRPHALRLDAEEIVALEAADPEKDRAWAKHLEGEAARTPEDRRLFTCGAGKNSLHVDPYGNVQVCLMVKNFRNDLREQSLADIFVHEFPKILAIEREPDSKCGGCASRNTCSSCPGIALWETRRNDAHVGFQCELTAVRERTYAGALREAAEPGPEPARRTDPASAAGSCASCSGGGCGGGLLQIGGIS